MDTFEKMVAYRRVYEASKMLLEAINENQEVYVDNYGEADNWVKVQYISEELEWLSSSLNDIGDVK